MVQEGSVWVEYKELKAEESSKKHNTPILRSTESHGVNKTSSGGRDSGVTYWFISLTTHA
ncbi:hypothetical protein AGDE_09460 [Angomonas deanei]|nr:hypothetical protein AGDE_10989 [Angomonas deanei]EPY29714.1 hypothetical protein AGDE_09897 [Angomonas deanei]EPY30405.1 hypothetical protein AGDE_09460 [Angomonas deanei]|eukprot:EPY26993.1 hypothetical protein AGDE_10989 [Angomonas deanei]